MAGIDYNISNQIKGVQVESPMNAMMQAMQLRGLQESSQMNALRAQEYQQKQQEALQLQQDRNKLAQILSAHEYGTPGFISAISRDLPHHLPTALENIDKFETAKSLRTKREEETTAAQLKNRETRRAAAISQIANAGNPQEALEMSQDFFAAGDIDQREVNSLMKELYNAPDMGKFSARRRIGLLDPKEALAEGRAIEEAGQKQFKANVEQTDARLKEFNAAFPALSIRSEADVAERIRAMAADEILGPLSQRFGSLEDTIARNVAEYKRNPINYVKRLSGVSAADILKTAEEKENQEYSQYRLNELLNRRKPLTQEEYFKSKRGAAAAPAAAAAAAPAVVDAAPAVATATATAPKAAYVEGLLGPKRPAAAIDQTATPAAAADATAVASATQETLAGAPVVKEDRVFGVDLLDPDAQALYTAAASEKDPTTKETYFKLAEKIQAESAARRRNQEFTGTYQNVDIALRELEQLKKEPLTPANEKRIEVLEGMIAAAQIPPNRPASPTQLAKEQDELIELENRLAAETDANKKKKLRERILQYKNQIKKSTERAPSVIVQGPKPTDTTLDFLANQYIQDPNTISAVPKQLRMAVVNRATEIMGKEGASGKDMAGSIVANRMDVNAQKASIKDFTSGKSALAVRSFNTAIDHLDTMSKLATALQNNDTRAFNTVGNFFAKQTGAAAPANFEAAKAIVGGEVAKALTGANMALKDREEIRDAIIASSSPAQLQGVLNTYKQLLGGQLSSLNIQYETSTGRDDFAAKLSPAAKRELNLIRPQSTAPKTSRTMSAEDKKALDWANSNPKDPRSAKIKARLGVK